MMIDDEFQDLISELDPSDTFGQLTPADITTIVPSFGGSDINEDEVGFVLEHEHLRQWGKVVAASYRDWLKSATPLLTKLTLHQSEAVILTSNYGSFFRVKFPYPSSPVNLGAEETIELHVRSSDLIELLFTGGPLKSFRYSKTKKTLRAYASLFERPILLHTPNMQLYRILPKNFDVQASSSLPLTPPLFHRMVAFCAPYISESTRNDASNSIQVSAGTLRMLADTAYFYFRSTSIDRRLDFKLPEQSLPIFLAASKVMETGHFTVVEGFNTVANGTTMFGWEVVQRDHLTDCPRRDELGVLLLPKATILNTLQRINGLLPDCAAVFSIKEAREGQKSKQSQTLEITASTSEGKKFRQVIDSMSFTRNGRSDDDVTFSIIPREALSALRYDTGSNAELYIEMKLVRITLDEGADEQKSEAILRNHSS
jgi:hypothetical protein